MMTYLSCNMATKQKTDELGKLDGIHEEPYSSYTSLILSLPTCDLTARHIG